ncbi:hypothetical protein ACFU44_18375 [Nocardia rhizosphaerihabitans]|uniref:hypothetical protein n=1 Tax=Nocardia rhizosphaerihabitans TaxID=1691570 RepID=UPI00366E4C61
MVAATAESAAARPGASPVPALPDDGTVPPDLVAKFWIDHGDLLRLVPVLNRAVGSSPPAL